ncbi:MAG: carbohydrate kinase [Verrucomicrobiae bacterium]|nr:carbohydrate kinase [Verrucomicrobiae bacterium]
MNPARFQEIASRYRRLRVAVLGDYCLDRYLEIDPARSEISIETGRQVHNVTHVRFQPGGAGTVLNNLVALGIGEILPLGFCGDDAEGHELQTALGRSRQVCPDHFLVTAERRTFTYCKPLLLHPDKAPEELNRLDFKNWTPTPADVCERLSNSLAKVFDSIDALIVLNQVDLPETGVITQAMLGRLRELVGHRPALPILGDSRTGFTNWPAISFKMNETEARHFAPSPDELPSCLSSLSKRTGRPLFTTLAENGILAATPEGATTHCPALPVRGDIDIVGAGDCVTANLTAALAAGATAVEAATIANLAASCVIHQLGTTGTADIPAITRLLAS